MPESSLNTKVLLSKRAVLISRRDHLNGKSFPALGFKTGVRPSRLPNAGNGVFVVEGHVPAGEIVALYPGTIYEPYSPKLLQSFNNPYILTCVDGKW